MAVILGGNLTQMRGSIFSSLHESYTRIDYLLVFPRLLQSVTNASIYPLVILEHAPIGLTFDVDKPSIQDPQF